MPSQSSELPPPDAGLKLSWEIQKLQTEVHALRRPFRNPSVVTALITTSTLALVGFGGLAIQLNRSVHEFTLAQIRVERLGLESEKLVLKTEKLALETSLLEERRTTLDSEILARNTELRLAGPQLAEIETVLAKGALTEFELKQVYSRLRHLLDRTKDASKPLGEPAAQMGVSPGTIQRGETATLDWSSINATSVMITPGIGMVAPSGKTKVSPVETTRYTITVWNLSGGYATGSVALIVADRE
jgi:hypothetical protein